MIEDTLKTAVDTIKTVADSTVVKTVAETTIWQDKTLMQTFGIIGGLLLFMIVILIITRDKKEKK